MLNWIEKRVFESKSVYIKVVIIVAEIIASLHGAGKKFFFNQVLTDISLKVQSGEILGLIGPSGSGKTTCIRCMLGMEDLTEGEARVLNEKMPKRKVLDKIGYMGQETALYETLTAHENMVFFGRLKNLKGEELKKEIDKNLKLVELENTAGKTVSKFSGGMKRRLSLAITLLGSPGFIVLDEPTVGIDPKLRLSVWQQLRELADSGAGIIVTTHVMSEAEKCDRVALLVEGKIFAQGTPKELMTEFKAASIEEVFINMEVDS